MRILAVETSGSLASIAASNGDTLSVCAWPAGRHLSAELVPTMQDVMRRASLAYSDLDAIAVGSGPGSYTGIRIGLAVSKAVAFAGRMPLVGISTLEVIAYGLAAWPGLIIAAVGLRDDRIGVASFEGGWESWARVSADRCEFLEQARRDLPAQSLICGSAAQLLGEGQQLRVAPAELSEPRADSLVDLAAAYLRAGGKDQLRAVQPNYLRPSSAEERARIAEVPS